MLFLNGLAITSVVLFHAVGMGFVAMISWSHRYLPPGVPGTSQIGSQSYYALRVFEQLIVFCIPAFLFVSGYFIAFATGKNRETISWSSIGTRLKTLLIPYVLWTFLILGLQLVLEGHTHSDRRLIYDIFTGATNEVMYFVPLLAQFYLLSPLLVWVAKKNWKLLLVVVLIIQLGVQLLAYPMFLGLHLPNAVAISDLIPMWFFPARILWFTMGIIFGLYLDQFKTILRRYRWVFLLVALLTIPLGLLEWELYFRLSGLEWLSHRETILDSIFGLVLILSFLGFSDTKLPFTKTFDNLGARSYGIFLTHAIFIKYAAKMIYHIAPRLLVYQIVLLPAFLVVGLTGSLGMMAVFDHTSLRRFHKYFFG